MIYGLDIFSGIGGLSLALRDYVKPLAYCEIDRYCRHVLLSRFEDGSLSAAPIWDDVKSFPTEGFEGLVDIIYGGFPCQDISQAGTRIGLNGSRSSLFYEVVRICGLLRPDFIFLENVPAITIRGLERVCGSITELGYSCRWTLLSARSVGANHRRLRWFLLGYNNRIREQYLADAADIGSQVLRTEEQYDSNFRGEVGNTYSQRLPIRQAYNSSAIRSAIMSDWWNSEPILDRMAYGIPSRVDRVKSLGNSVVPLQAKIAFQYLTGMLQIK
jgi:DNA (cytosine-5)-methyltransferase 1